jgi:hypothetical protein
MGLSHVFSPPVGFDLGIQTLLRFNPAARKKLAD